MTESNISPAPSYRLAAIPAKGERVMLHSLTGVRAAAAIAVVIAHFTPYIHTLFPGFREASRITSFGYLGVDLFFALSGFILCHNYMAEFRGSVSPGAYGRFLWLRLARIYPVHLFTLIVLLAGVIGAQAMHKPLNMPGYLTENQFVQNLLLIHAWTPSGHMSWNVPAWSISAEWLAYLLFPMLMIAMAQIAKPRTAWMGFALAFEVLLVTAYKSPHEPLLATTFWEKIFGTGAPPIRILTEFIAGCMLYRLYDAGWAAKANWERIGLACFAAVIAIMVLQPLSTDGQGLYVPSTGGLWPAPLLAIIVLALARGRGPVTRFFSTRSMIFMGEASYALYMTHEVVRMFLFKGMKPDHFVHASPIVRAGVLFAYFAIIAAVGIGTYLLIEVPARNYLRKLVGRRPKPMTLPPHTPATA